MKKVYTRSKVIFNTELTTTSTGVPSTREDVRKDLVVDYKQIDGGIGFQVIGSNIIIT